MRAAGGLSQNPQNGSSMRDCRKARESSCGLCGRFADSRNPPRLQAELAHTRRRNALANATLASSPGVRVRAPRRDAGRGGQRARQAPVPVQLRLRAPGRPHRCLRRDGVRGIQFSTLTQAPSCAVPAPHKWPPLVQVPDAAARAPTRRCSSSENCPVTVLLTGQDR